MNSQHTFRRALLNVSRVVVLSAFVIVASGHIGSPDAWFNGIAGPYHVRVQVKAPQVVPGIAVVNVTPVEAVTGVSAFVNKFDAVGGGPPPDIAVPLASDPQTYSTRLWVMDPGSNSVTVLITGAKGEGKVVVPLVAVAARRLEFNGALTALLGAAALILVAGLVSVIGAAARESSLPPGTAAATSDRQQARRTMLRGALAIVVVVTALGFWWRAEDRAFVARLFRPLAVAATIRDADSTGKILEFAIVDSQWTMRNTERRMRIRGGNELTDLVADHGKLMHLFMIAEDGASGFAHLHPSTIDSVHFTSALPPLPAGRYRVFADVTHSTGFAQTLATTVDVPSPAGVAASLLDADDAWSSATTALTDSAVLSDGVTLTLLKAAGAREAGSDAGLRFAIARPPGDSAQIEPYMGMAGHAVVIRDDGRVFIHLHPMGTVSAVAQSLLSSGGVSHDMSMAPGDTLEFPYAFPEAGRYTVWVQFRRRGMVQSAAFRVMVLEPRKR